MTDVVYPGHLSDINGLSSNLQLAQGSISCPIGTAYLPTFFFHSETLILPPPPWVVLLFLHVQRGLAGYLL